MIDAMPELTTYMPNLHATCSIPEVSLPEVSSFLVLAGNRVRPQAYDSHQSPGDSRGSGRRRGHHKMLYASHYFWTGIEFRALVPDPARGTASGS